MRRRSGPYSQSSHHSPLVSGDAGVEHEVVVARTGHLERVELQAPEALDGGQDRCRLRRQRARRGQQVAPDEEAPRVGGGDLQIGHSTDRSGGS